MNLDAFEYQPLRGGFLLVKVVVNTEPMFDAMGRGALARTSIIGANITIESNLQRLRSRRSRFPSRFITKCWRRATVGALNPPTAVCELNEAGFEAAALRAHAALGPASLENLNRMLEGFGF